MCCCCCCCCCYCCNANAGNIRSLEFEVIGSVHTFFLTHTHTQMQAAIFIINTQNQHQNSRKSNPIKTNTTHTHKHQLAQAFLSSNQQQLFHHQISTQAPQEWLARMINKKEPITSHSCCLLLILFLHIVLISTSGGGGGGGGYMTQAAEHPQQLQLGPQSGLKFEPESNSYSGLTFTFDPRLDKRVEWLHFEHWLSIMQQTSALLYESLNGRAHLNEVRVLIPYKWRQNVWPVLHKPGVPIIINRRLRYSDSDVIVGFEGKFFSHLVVC